MTNNTLILLVLLLIIDLTITATRSGLLNIRYERLVSLQKKGHPKVEKTLELVSRRARLRSSLKLAQSLLRFMLAGLAFFAYFPINDLNLSTPTVIAALLIIAFLIWLVEFVVERIIFRNPENWALRLTPIANLLVILLSPILLIPMRIFNGKSSSRNLVTITEDELKSLVDISQRSGEIDEDESEMIYSVFDFGDRLAREIMVPRVDMLSLNVETPLDQAADALLESGFSRVPVYQNQHDNIIGLLYAKDILKVWRSENKIDNMKDLIRPAKFVPETKKVDDLLDEMQANRTHIAIVVDEYGGVAGLVTLEDIVEEIFGEIQDEYDEGEEDPYQEISPDEYLFHGRILLDEVNDLMDSNLSTEDADTLGGLIYNRIGRVPKTGEVLKEDGFVLTVEDVSERRIRKVRVKRNNSD